MESQIDLKYIPELSIVKLYRALWASTIAILFFQRSTNLRGPDVCSVGRGRPAPPILGLETYGPPGCHTPPAPKKNCFFTELNSASIIQIPSGLPYIHILVFSTYIISLTATQTNNNNENKKSSVEAETRPWTGRWSQTASAQQDGKWVCVSLTALLCDLIFSKSLQVGTTSHLSLSRDWHEFRKFRTTPRACYLRNLAELSSYLNGTSRAPKKAYEGVVIP